MTAACGSMEAKFPAKMEKKDFDQQMDNISRGHQITLSFVDESGATGNGGDYGIMPQPTDAQADFTINSAPVDITFTCPHCRWQTGVPFEDVDEPECWQDDWGSVECPHCGEEVELGERSYD